MTSEVLELSRPREAISSTKDGRAVIAKEEEARGNLTREGTTVRRAMLLYPMGLGYGSVATSDLAEGCQGRDKRRDIVPGLFRVSPSH